MIDPTAKEIDAIYAGSDRAGQYLESIGKTDMATFSQEEWLTLIEVAITGYVDKMAEIHDSEIPF